MASPATNQSDGRRAIRTIAAAFGALILILSAMPLIGHDATWFGRLTNPLQFWHEPPRSRDFDAMIYCDTSVVPPRVITEEEFAECYRTSVFDPGAEPSLARMGFAWRAYPRSGVWAPTRWSVRITCQVTECIPEKASDSELTSAATLAIDQALAADPYRHRLALDALHGAQWHDHLGLAAEFTLPGAEGYRTNAISAASLALVVWALWPRRRVPGREAR